MAKDSKTILLGERLVQLRIITREQLQEALEYQRQSKQLLGIVLLEKGFIKEEQVFFSLLARHTGADFVELSDLVIDRQVLEAVPVQFASHYQIIPVRMEKDVLVVAGANPADRGMIDALHMVWPEKIRAVMASPREIAEAIRQYYGVGAETIDAMMEGRRGSEASVQGADDITELDSEASIGKFLNQILLEAYQKRATDIHIEPFEDQLKIRYRIDGTLQDVQLPVNIWHFRDAISSRIKIMSNLNIAEKRLPQDGRFKVKVGGFDLDLRVSFLPTPYGESIVIRLLSSGKVYDLAELGLNQRHLNILQELIRHPHGIIFVTGPTGSGKTTTLYCCLSKVMTGDQKIITIEDPIEYSLKGVVQLQVNPKIGFTFSAGLRSMLRHDPDIMMVGEVRDLETAQIAIQVALTGHLVFSTLHTNDAIGGITRLFDMGVEPYLVSSAVDAFIAQRLVRKICPKCKTQVRVGAQILRESGFPADEDMLLWEGKGCEACDFSGYHGREGIFEFFVMNDELREMVARKASAMEIKARAAAAGMTTLLADGWQKITDGRTTVSEVVRVTKEEDAVQA